MNILAMGIMMALGWMIFHGKGHHGPSREPQPRTAERETPRSGPAESQRSPGESRLPGHPKNDRGPDPDPVPSKPDQP